MQIPAQVPAQVKVPASQPTRVFELNRRRIYIMPTRHGIAFAISVAVMLVGSVNYANSLGYLLTFLLASVGLVSLLHTYRNLAGLSIRMSDPQPVFAGNGLAIPLAIDNRKGAERIAVSITHPAAISARPAERNGEFSGVGHAPRWSLKASRYTRKAFKPMRLQCRPSNVACSR